MTTQDRFAHIDSLRAVAALLVVWTHSAEFFAPLSGGSWMFDVSQHYNFGRMGVIAFFGVSGFLIPASLREGTPNAGRTFAIRRFCRLFPAYWLSIPLGIWSMWILFGSEIRLWEIAANLTMVPDLLNARPVMASYWTLGYELAFYGLCLVLFKAGALDRRYVAALLTLAFLGVYVLGFAGLVALDRQSLADIGLVSLNFGCFFLGTLWRRALDARLDRLERLALAAALALFWVATPAACAYAIYGHGSANPFFVQMPVSYGVGVAIFIAMTSVAKVRWRPLAWIGLISYSLYLLHPVAVYALRYVFDHRGPGSGLPVSLQMLAATALAVAMAAAAFYAVERPAIALGRRLSAMQDRRLRFA